MIQLGNRLRNRSGFWKHLGAFFDSSWYPAAFAAICAVSGVHGKAVYIPLACLLMVLMIASSYLAENKRSLITPFLLSLYCLGTDNPVSFHENNGDLMGFYDMDSFVAICLIGVVSASFLVTRLWQEGVFRDAFRKPSAFFLGLLFLDGALLCGGLFNGNWHPYNLLYGLLFAGVLTVFYGIFRGILDNREESAQYVCKILVCMGFMVAAQILTVTFRAYAAGTLYEYAPNGNRYMVRDVLQLGWGVSTSISGVMVLGIPAAMYLAKDSRLSPAYYGAALLFVAVAMVITARSSMLVGIAAMLFCSVICCFAGKSRKVNRFCTLGLVLLGLLAVAYVHFRVMPLEQLWDKLSWRLRLDGSEKDTRTGLWEKGYQDFLSAPVFGVGFHKGAFAAEDRRLNVFSNMYHSIIIQFAAATGSVGLLALLWHGIDLIRAVFRRFTAGKLILLMVPGMILAMSLVDNFFFYANYQFVYCLFLALIERTDTKRLTE